jgi:hypothetical protein
VGRQLGILAYFVPDFDACYAPSAGDAIHGFSWIFNGASPESQYAFSCVDRLGFSEVLQESIRALFDKNFESGEDALLVHIALALSGCCALLENAVDAHLSAVGRYLRVDTEKLRHDLNQPSGRREHQVVCEFWGLTLLRDYPQLLVKTVDDFHRGRRSSAKVTAPSFLEILAQSQSV